MQSKVDTLQRLKKSFCKMSFVLKIAPAMQPASVIQAQLIRVYKGKYCVGISVFRNNNLTFLKKGNILSVFQVLGIESYISVITGISCCNNTVPETTHIYEHARRKAHMCRYCILIYLYENFFTIIVL